MTTVKVHTSRDQIKAMIENYKATALGGQAEKKSAISTGYTDFDTVLGGGFQIGSLHTISGNEGCGKTTLLENIAKRMLAADLKVLFVSSEQSRDIVLAQMIQTGLHFASSSADIHSGNIEVTNSTELANALQFYSEHDLTIQCCHMFSEIRAVTEEVKPQVLIVDSIQGMMAGQSSTDIFQETARNVSALNALAIEKNITVIVVSHANREGRKNVQVLKNYNLSNSGMLEYLSSSITFVRQLSDEIVQRVDPKSGEVISPRVLGHSIELRVSKTRLRDYSNEPTCRLLWEKDLTSIKDDPSSSPPPKDDADSELRARCRAIVDAYNSLKEGGSNAGTKADQIR